MLPILAVGLMLAAALPGSDQESLGAAKDLYAAAAYEEALSTLTRLNESAVREMQQDVEQYRAFCLFALGRTREAQSAVEALIRINPFFEPDRSEASPRIVDMFTEVRKYLLPDLIRDQYRAARAARDANNLTEALAQLVATRRMLDEAERLEVRNDSLGDLGVLVDGFLDLIRAAEKPQRAAAAAPADVPAALRGGDSAPPVGSAPISARTYTSVDPDVTAPVTIRQAVPEPPPQLLGLMRANGQRSGSLDLLIDETGAVQDVSIREPLNSAYDDVLLRTARTWKYRPAMRGGEPVKYLKTVTITVSAKD